MPEPVEHDSAESTGNPDTLPHRRSVGACLVAVREQMGNFEHRHKAWATQLLIFLPDAHTPQDIHDWLGALTPDLCEARPDLLLRLSEHLCNLLPDFSKKDLFECVERCLDIARSAKQSGTVWMRICAGLPKLALPAMDELLTCLQKQGDHGRLPENLQRLIVHVQNVIDRLKDLPRKHFNALPGTTLVIPTITASTPLPRSGIMAIDTGSGAFVIDAPVAATNREPMLNPDVLGLVMGHLLNEEGIDWAQPGDSHQIMRAGRVLLDRALINRGSGELFRPMLANSQWMQARNDLRMGSDRNSSGLISKLIDRLVDLDAEAVTSLPCAKGVAQRRLDVVLRALLDGPTPVTAYSSLHERAVVQLATRGKMSPCFAEHIGLWALPLHTLAMAYRMLGRETLPFGRLFASIGSFSLSAYPEEVQAQTLIGLLSLLPTPADKDEVLTRLERLMRELGPWPADAPHAWLRYQWDHLSDMLALIENPATVFVGDAADVPNDLLAQLHRHHGLSRSPALLIDDPFGERYVPWAIADIRLLAALCQRTTGPGDWKPSELIDCLVDLLRQFCLVSMRDEKFAASSFMAAFPAGTFESAFRRLTPEEQWLVLVRPYDSGDDPHIGLIVIFAQDGSIAPKDRESCLRAVRNVAGAHPDLVHFLRHLQ
jgi:hypothetical protein